MLVNLIDKIFLEKYQSVKSFESRLGPFNQQTIKVTSIEERVNIKSIYLRNKFNF